MYSFINLFLSLQSLEFGNALLVFNQRVVLDLGADVRGGLALGLGSFPRSLFLVPGLSGLREFSSCSFHDWPDAA